MPSTIRSQKLCIFEGCRKVLSATNDAHVSCLLHREGKADRTVDCTPDIGCDECASFSDDDWNRLARRRTYTKRKAKTTGKATQSKRRKVQEVKGEGLDIELDQEQVREQNPPTPGVSPRRD